MTERLAIFASGGGRSVENLAECVAAGELDAELALVLVDRPDAGVLARAERLGIPAAVLRYSGCAEFSTQAFALAEEHGCTLTVLAGFLRLLTIPEPWIGRVINIHPSLIPAFCGKGYYGDRVHRAVIERGVQFTGCTVHFVDNVYDNGPIILQRCIPVNADDTADTIAKRVFEEEKLALPEAIRRVSSGSSRYVDQT